MKGHVMLPVPDNSGAEARAIRAGKKHHLPCWIEIVRARRSSNEDSGLAVRHEPGIDRAIRKLVAGPQFAGAMRPRPAMGSEETSRRPCR